MYWYLSWPVLDGFKLFIYPYSSGLLNVVRYMLRCYYTEGVKKDGHMKRVFKVYSGSSLCAPYKNCISYSKTWYKYSFKYFAVIDDESIVLRGSHQLMYTLQNCLSF